MEAKKRTKSDTRKSSQPGYVPPPRPRPPRVLECLSSPVPFLPPSCDYRLLFQRLSNPFGMYILTWILNSALRSVVGATSVFGFTPLMSVFPSPQQEADPESVPSYAALLIYRACAVNKTKTPSSKGLPSRRLTTESCHQRRAPHFRSVEVSSLSLSMMTSSHYCEAVFRVVATKRRGRMNVTHL